MESSNKYYGQFDPPVDKIIHERYFPDKKRGFSIECGAFDGITECSAKIFEESMDWISINIEPLPHIFEMLQKNRPESINLNIALSNEECEKTITVYDIRKYGINNTNASISHTDKHRKLLENISNGKKDIKVYCKTYTSLIERLKIKYIDLFVLDVEGHEPEVIDGMKDCDILPEVFVIEHGHRNPDFFVEKLKILKCKYRLDHISHVNSFFVKE